MGSIVIQDRGFVGEEVWELGGEYQVADGCGGEGRGDVEV